MLATIALDVATTTNFGPASLPGPDERWYERLRVGPHFDIWLIRWGAGSRTAVHDHGGSAGAFVVVEGRLVEYMPNPAGTGRRLRRDFRALDSRPMAASHIHTVVNESDAPATSVHVYSPPLVAMQHYDDSPGTGAPRPGFREIVDHGTLPARDAVDR
jgi:predicted metal-dependent enzyme (double-stranded beta helix superfamily)